MIAPPFANPVFADDVHLDTQKVSQVHQQSAQIEQRTTGLQTDDEVEVRILGGVAVRDGAENADVRSTVFSRHGDDLLAAIDDVGSGNHHDTLPDASLLCRRLSRYLTPSNNNLCLRRVSF